MRKKAGTYLSGTGFLGFIIMGSALDSAAWKTALVLAVMCMAMILIGIRMMDIRKTLEEKGFRYESKSAREQKNRNREEVFRTWKTTW